MRLSILFIKTPIVAVTITIMVLNGCTCARSHEKSVQTDSGDSGQSDSEDSSLRDVGSQGDVDGHNRWCGNGILEPPEQCEAPSNFGGHTCMSLGQGSGVLRCDPLRCIFDTSMCFQDDGAISIVDSSTQAPWRPPFETDEEPIWSDEPGWEMSADLFSTGKDPNKGWYVDSCDIWSDTRGVYALVSLRNNYEEDVQVGEGGNVFFNDGTGWTSIYSDDTPRSYAGFSGFPQGPLVFYGFLELECGIVLMEDGERSCTTGLNYVTDLFVVDANLAYATYENRVLVYEGNSWYQLAEAIDPTSGVNTRAIWGNENVVAVADSIGIHKYERDRNSVFETQTDAPDGDYSLVWGFSENDIWAATRRFLVHFDGEDWQIIWDCANNCGRGIRGMWGDDGKLYFHTSNQFARWNGSQIEILARWADNKGVEIQDIWGNSPSEVFLCVLDGEPENPIYGETLLVWFDGEQLRQF
jgi:hypothetical protein